MNRSSIIKAPTFAKDGMVKIIVLKITLRNLAFLISLKIRPILKARATVAYLGPKMTEDTVRLKIRVTKEMMTMIKSKTFQPLVKYPLIPSPMIFMIASRVKMAVKK